MGQGWEACFGGKNLRRLQAGSSVDSDSAAADTLLLLVLPCHYPDPALPQRMWRQRWRRTPMQCQHRRRQHWARASGAPPALPWLTLGTRNELNWRICSALLN